MNEYQQSGQKVADKVFNFDIAQFVASENRLALHMCQIPENNPCFTSTPIPWPGALCFVTGFLHSKALQDPNTTKRLPIEIKEVAFLSAEPGQASTPAKGDVKFESILSHFFLF